MYTDVLNPRLYAALEQAFGEVLVADQGSRRETAVLPDWNRGGAGLKTLDVCSGEYYRVDCPFCAVKQRWDSRHRLWINHEWDQIDERTGRRNLHLAICYNEECLQEAGRPRELYNLVYPLGRSRHESTPRPAKPIMAAPAQPIQLPPECIRLDQLGLDHPANLYLAGRGFDPHFLGRQWGVGYCAVSITAMPPINNRIVVPIMRPSIVSMPGGPAETLAGWQARAINEANEPKYLTAQGMRKSEILYGLTSAIQSRGPILVVEGVTDVWRLGGNAVAPLGKSMSRAQKQLLIAYFPGRPIVLMLDADAADKAHEACASLRQARTATMGVAADNRVVVAQLPPDRKDVADCGYEEAWRVAFDALGPK